MQDRSLVRWVNEPPARNRCHEQCDIGIPWPSLFYSRTIVSPFSRFLDMRTSCVFEHCLSNWEGFLISCCYVLILAQNSRISSLLSTNSRLVVENYFCRPGRPVGVVQKMGPGSCAIEMHSIYHWSYTGIIKLAIDIQGSSELLCTTSLRCTM